MLEKYLKKLGLSSYEELNEDEKNTYREWEESLAGKDVTIKELKEFLLSELDIAISKLTDINLTHEDETFRKVEVRVIKKMLNFIESPKVAKKFAEKAISELMK